MKINVALVLSIILAVGLVALGFTAVQISSEREKLYDELKVSTIKTGEEIYTNYLADSAAPKLTDSIIGKYNLGGIAIYNNADSIQTFNAETKKYLTASTDYIVQAIAA